MSLEQLIENCKKNDIKAQSELYTKFSCKLFPICLKYSRNYQEAEDNLQDAFLTIFKKIHQYKGNGSFEGWLKRIVVNTVLQQYRKIKFTEITIDESIETIDIEVENEHVPLSYLLQIIQELPDRYRMVFNLYVLDGILHKDIAKLLHITEGTSKSNLARAKHILKQKIERFNPDNTNFYES